MGGVSSLRVRWARGGGGGERKKGGGGRGELGNGRRIEEVSTGESGEGIEGIL